MSIISDYIESLNIPAGTRHRSDCSFCGHNNSFSAFNDGTYIMYKCFYADCNVKGRVRTRLYSGTMPEHKKRIQGRESTSTTAGTFFNKPLNSLKQFELPDTFVDIGRSPEAMKYIKDVNVYDSYTHRRVRLMYDQRLNRAVYLIYDGAHIVDAVGRSLTGMKPKWYRYGSSKQLFVAGEAPDAVLVEDCASASCVSHLISGVAMLGTSLLKEHIVQLKKFDNVYVALDKDATKIGLKTVQALKPYVNVRLLILEDDFKNRQKGKLDEFIRRKTARNTDTAVHTA